MSFKTFKINVVETKEYELVVMVDDLENQKEALQKALDKIKNNKDQRSVITNSQKLEVKEVLELK